jgi:cytidine deaminase
VGAALIPAIGTPVLTGTNEVPKPGGGQYWTTDEPDHRDFQSGNDPNPVYIKRLLEQVLERLSADEWLAEDLEGLNGEQLLERARKADMLDGTRAESLIEFTRCLHAEEAAIINAARAGVSTQGASLFTTTFPCHECTKMIVGAGIIEVQYIEPYPKSMADRLYRDLIETEPPAAAAGGLVNGKVPFRAFQGIAPRRYHIAFRAGERRSGVKAAGHDAKSNPRTSGWSEDAIATSELIAIGSLKQIMDAHSASLGMISATAEPVDDLSPAPDGEAGPDQASGTDGT